MDKKSLIGLLLITAIVFGFSMYNAKQAEKYMAAHPEEFEQVAESAESNVTQVEQQAAVFETAMNDSLANVAMVAQYGENLVAASRRQAESFTVENDVMKITFSTRGGAVEGVELKDYERYQGGQIQMFKEGTNKFALQFYYKRNLREMLITTSDYAFEVVKNEALADGGHQVVMRLAFDADAYMDYIYTLQQDSYMIDYDVNFVGMREGMMADSELVFDWKNTSLQNEQGYKNENTYTTLSYMFPNAKKISDLGMSEVKRGGGTKSKSVQTKVDWFAFKQQFFSSVFVAKEQFQNADFSYRTHEEGTGMIKDFSAVVSVPFSPNQTEYDFDFYFGPNKYSVLKEFQKESGEDLQMEKLVPLGGWLVGWVNRWMVIPVFDFLSKYIGNIGIVILILTILIKALIYPLTHKSYMSSAKIRALKPEIDALNAKYPRQEDALKKQQAQMELYKQCGVNPMGGCLPMLIQFPFLVAMFRFFPASIELRGQSFLWAKDLSSYDAIVNLPFNIPWYGDHISLFALLMVIVMFFYSKITYEQQSAAGGQEMPGMKFMMVYMMPIMMLLWFNGYASGLCYYYLLSQIITIIQYTAFRYGVDESKLRTKLLSSKKNVKKSKWQQRLEEIQRQQMELQRQQAKQQRK